MKKLRVLEVICYICIPILIGALALSICSLLVQEDTAFDKRGYYISARFVGTYMNDISNACEDLIYNNGNYYNISDGDKIIYYTNVEEYYSNVEDFKYLIIYKNKALTNVDLNDNTKTIEGIKQYINESKSSKKVNIINGNIMSENEKIQKQGMQYLPSLSYKYYTLEENVPQQYFDANSNDFEIYSFYVEGFKNNSEEKAILNLITSFSIITDNSSVIIPSCSVLLILIIIYLLTAIGKDEKLSDFDKIPFEIIVLISIVISSICIILATNFNYNSFNNLLIIIITSFLIIYVLTTVCFNTFIKRVKSKMFWKTTITGTICFNMMKLINKIFLNIKNQYKKISDTLAYSKDITVKVIIYTCSIVLIAFLILIIFRINFSTFILELTLFSIFLYKIIKILKNYSQIENKLKEMSEGNNKNSLDLNEFKPELINSARYINNISKGVEKEIQERMKSEKLKAELITNVSHDIKTPLTSIINYVDLLKKENIENEKAREYISILDNKSQRLKKLTEDLVEASKVSTGNISLNLEKINIVELIKQAEGEFEDRFQKKNIDTIINNNENDIYIMVDSRYMYRIIENLFSNVAKYALENSRMYIDIKKIDKKVNIEIKNISKEKLNISSEELIQRFVRGDKSRTSEGSGLGLSIAQNLTELQKGKFNLILDGDLFKVKMEFNLI